MPGAAGSAGFLGSDCSFSQPLAHTAWPCPLIPCCPVPKLTSWMNMADITLRINGSEKKITVSPETPLLWVLRDTLELTGTKFGCGAGLCGACTVHVEGSAIRSCSTPVSQVADKTITTIASLSAHGLHISPGPWLAQ